MKTTFRSHYRRMAVAFPPETFGYAKGAKIMKDRQGNALHDEDGSLLHEQLLKPTAQFEGGELTLDDEKPAQAVMILDLKRILNDEELHLANGDFWEEEAGVTAHVNAKLGEVSVTFPDELTPEDEVLLKQLNTYFHNSIPGSAMKSAAAKLQDAIARFNVIGIILPGPGREKLVRARIQELCYALDDAAKASGVTIPMSLDVKESA